MATVKEKFLNNLIAQGRTAIEAASLLATMGNLRWNNDEREYPEQFYNDRLAALTQSVPTLKTEESATVDTDKLPPIEVVTGKRGAKRG